MSIHRKLTTVCCAAVLALGLAACGSSDDDKKMVMNGGGNGGGGMELSLASLQGGTEVPAGTHMITGDADALTALYTALVAFAPDVPADGYAPGSEAVEVGGLMLMCSARSTVNCNLSIDEDAQTITVTGLILVHGADGMFPDDRTDEQKVADAAAAVEKKTAEALTKETAIGVEAASNGEAGLGGTDATLGTSPGNYELEIERDAMATTVTVTVHGDNDDEDVTFMKAADLYNAAGHMGRKLVNEMDADEDGNVVTEIAIVYTDIDEPTAMDFADVHDLDANPETENGTDYQSVEVGTANLAMIETDGINSIGAGQITVLAAVPDDENTMDVDETVVAFETDATFDGAPGTLKCAGTADCTVTLDGDGDITAFGAGWEFTPDPDETVNVADADYLHYGVWLQKTTDEEGVTTYDEVQTFAGASGEGLPPSGTVADVEGSAEYKGGAAGVYVHKTFAGDGTSEATAGHFKANASLKAYFSAGDIPFNKVNTLQGTIDKFVLEHGEENEWSVALQSTESTSGSHSGTAKGGVTGEDGSFEATFHGATGDADDVQPSSVVGEFNAVFSNGSVAGGFGASQPEE